MVTIAAVPPLGHFVPVPTVPERVLQRIGRVGWAEDWRLAFAALSAAGAVLIGLAAARWWAHHRGRRLLPAVPRWAVRTAAGTSATLLTLFGLAVGANAYVGYIPNLGPVTHTEQPRLAAAGPPGSRLGPAVGESQVVLIHIGSAADHMAPNPAYVYLPPGYNDPRNSDVRYPVVYLIHGSPGKAIDWFRAGRAAQTMDLLISRHLIGPMIVVAPTASTGWWKDQECLNSPGGVQLEHYLSVTVPNAIDQRYRTIADRRGRAIGGMSSGAFCALNIGLHHLHRFSTILAAEPYGTPGVDPLTTMLHGSWPLYLANSPSWYLPHWRLSPPVAVFVDTGSADRGTLATAHWFANEFDHEGATVALRIVAGEHHTWRAARLGLPYALIFAWESMQQATPGGSDAADAAQFAQALSIAAHTDRPPVRTLLRPAPGAPDSSPSARASALPRHPATRR